MAFENKPHFDYSSRMLLDFLDRFSWYHVLRHVRLSHLKKHYCNTASRRKAPYQVFLPSKDKKEHYNLWALKQLKWRLSHFKADLYFWKLNHEMWLGNIHHIHGLYEYLNGCFLQEYACDYQGKVVLDIGGYIGDTARFFLKKQAAKVIIVEPLAKNIECIQYNLADYKSQVEILPKGVGEKEGSTIVHSQLPEGHIGFCFNQSSGAPLCVDTITFSSLLQTYPADIAKVDCEGGERYLLDVPATLLQLVDYWMIEAHTQQMAKRLTEKFLTSGFRNIYAYGTQNQCSILHFSKSTPLPSTFIT